VEQGLRGACALACEVAMKGGLRACSGVRRGCALQVNHHGRGHRTHARRGKGGPCDAFPCGAGVRRGYAFTCRLTELTQSADEVIGHTRPQGTEEVDGLPGRGVPTRPRTSHSHKSQVARHKSCAELPLPLSQKHHPTYRAQQTEHSHQWRCLPYSALHSEIMSHASDLLNNHTPATPRLTQ